jgi:hypothetical protein
MTPPIGGVDSRFSTLAAIEKALMKARIDFLSTWERARGATMFKLLIHAFEQCSGFAALRAPSFEEAASDRLI